MEVSKSFLESLGWHFDHDEDNGWCFVNCCGEKIYIFCDYDLGCYILEDEIEDFGNFYSPKEIYKFVKSWENKL